MCRSTGRRRLYSSRLLVLTGFGPLGAAQLRWSEGRQCLPRRHLSRAVGVPSVLNLAHALRLPEAGRGTMFLHGLLRGGSSVFRGVLLLVAALLGCSPEVREIELAELDLTDMTTVQDIRARLDKAEGAAFASYVAKHYVRSAAYCGRPLVTADGEPPATVGEAIDLTLTRDAEDRRALEEAAGPRHPRELAKQEWDELISERDTVIDAQSRLLEVGGTASQSSREWKTLEARKLKLDGRLAELKPRAFGTGD